MNDERENGLQPDPLIGKLVPDPAKPGVQSVVGFRLGASDRPDYWRLYVNLDLTEYLEFRKEDCLDGKEMRGRTTVWLKQNSAIAHTRTDESAMQFVRGDVRKRFFRSTGFDAVARAINQGGGGGTLGTCATGGNCCLFTITRPG